jgi:hypothetical protein
MPPVARPPPLVRPCPYRCGTQLSLEAPYRGNGRTDMIVECVNPDCRKRVKASVVNGRVTGLFTPQKFKFGSRLRTLPPPDAQELGPVANLAEEACEAAYLSSPRAGAVALRAATELFAHVRLFNRSPGGDIDTLRREVTQIASAPGFQQLTHHLQVRTKADLEEICCLGDSGAHHRLNDPSRRRDVTPTRVEAGVRRLERVLEACYGWS